MNDLGWLFLRITLAARLCCPTSESEPMTLHVSITGMPVGKPLEVMILRPKEPLERKEKGAGGVSSTAGSWGANLGIAK